MRELVDEALDRKNVVVRTDAAPEAGIHTRRLLAVELHTHVRNVVWNVPRRIDTVWVDTLLEEGRQETRDDGGAGDLVFPADDATAVETCRQQVVVRRTVDVVA